MSKNTNPGMTISFSVKIDLLDKLDAQANEWGLTRSKMLAILIKEGLKGCDVNGEISRAFSEYYK